MRSERVRKRKSSNIGRGPSRRPTTLPRKDFAEVLCGASPRRQRALTRRSIDVAHPGPSRPMPRQIVDRAVLHGQTAAGPELGSPQSECRAPARGSDESVPRSFAADAHDCIMVRIKRPYRIQVCSTKMCPNGELPSEPPQTDTHPPNAEAMPKTRLAVHRRSACSGVKALRNTSDARRQTAKLCYRFGPLTPSARSANLIVGERRTAFPAPNKEPAKTKNDHLTRKAPYKFESISLQQTVCELSVPEWRTDRRGTTAPMRQPDRQPLT